MVSVLNFERRNGKAPHVKVCSGLHAGTRPRTRCLAPLSSRGTGTHAPNEARSKDLSVRVARRRGRHSLPCSRPPAASSRSTPASHSPTKHAPILYSTRPARTRAPAAHTRPVRFVPSPREWPRRRCAPALCSRPRPVLALSRAWPPRPPLRGPPTPRRPPPRRPCPAPAAAGPPRPPPRRARPRPAPR